MFLNISFNTMMLVLSLVNKYQCVIQGSSTLTKVLQPSSRFFNPHPGFLNPNYSVNIYY